MWMPWVVQNMPQMLKLDLFCPYHGRWSILLCIFQQGPLAKGTPTTFACQKYDRIHRSCPRSFHSNHRLIFHVINVWWFGSNNTVDTVVSSHQNTQSDFPTLKWLISLFTTHLVGILNSSLHYWTQPSVDVWHIHAFPGLQLSATSDLHLWLPGEASTSTDNSRA